MKSEIPAEMFFQRSRQITGRDRAIECRREEWRLDTDVGFLFSIHRRIQERIDEIAFPVFDDDNVAYAYVSIDVVYVLSGKIRRYHACHAHVIRGEAESLQVGALQIECEFVCRIRFACIDSSVECEGYVGILDLSLPLEHFRTPGSL